MIILIRSVIVVSVILLSGCANAGKDQSVDANTLVKLDAKDSTANFNGKITTYSWKQIRGRQVSLSNKDAISPVFTVPNVNKKETLLFEVTIIEKRKNLFPFISRDTVNIVINPKTIIEKNHPLHQENLIVAL